MVLSAAYQEQRRPFSVEVVDLRRSVRQEVGECRLEERTPRSRNGITVICLARRRF